MLIEEGFWNYYLAFRISNCQKYIAKIANEKDFFGLLAVAGEGEVLSHSDLEGILREQKDESCEQIAGQSIAELKSLSTCFRKVLHESGHDKCVYYALMPVKIHVDEHNVIYCPVYIYLLGNGSGVIKLEMPLKNISADKLSHYPMKRWFGDIEVWDSLRDKDGEKNYKLVHRESETIQDITSSLTSFVKRIFAESLIGGEQFTGLDSLMLSKTSDYDIIRVSKLNENVLKQIYSLVNPEDFAVTMSKTELSKFWEQQHFDASGIHVIKGYNAKLLMYADALEIMKNRKHTNIVDCNAYLERSISRTYDPFLVLALAQKDNEISVCRAAQYDSHTINQNMRLYYANANYLEAILQQAPKHGIIFYKEIRKMLDNLPVNFREMLENIKRMEDYDKMKFQENREKLLRQITFIFTTFFGLPLIHETLSVLKGVIAEKIDVIPVLSVGSMSIIVWMVLLVYVIKKNIGSYMEYYR